MGNTEKYVYTCRHCGKKCEDQYLLQAFPWWDSRKHKNLCQACAEAQYKKGVESTYNSYWEKASLSSKKYLIIKERALGEVALPRFMSQFHPRQKEEKMRPYYDLLIVDTGIYGYVMMHEKLINRGRPVPKQIGSYIMSEIKKKPEHLDEIHYDYMAPELPLSDGKIVRIWKKPFLICAMTEFDMNYRKEWDGPGEYITYNEYGDTSNFYIIGDVFLHPETLERMRNLYTF